MSRKDISDRLVCLAYYVRQRTGCSAHVYELLANRTGQPEKVCYRAMERAFERGYIEYGVSLRSGWLTPEGLDLLSAAGGDR